MYIIVYILTYNILFLIYFIYMFKSWKKNPFLPLAWLWHTNVTTFKIKEHHLPTEINYIRLRYFMGVHYWYIYTIFKKNHKKIFNIDWDQNFAVYLNLMYICCILINILATSILYLNIYLQWYRLHAIILSFCWVIN